MTPVPSDYIPSERERRLAGSLHSLAIAAGPLSPLYRLLLSGFDVLTLPLMGALFSALAALPMGGFARWAGGVARRMGQARGAPSMRFLRWHVGQSLRFTLLYTLLAVLTCGVGGVLGFPLYFRACRAAAAAARRGEWAPLSWRRSTPGDGA